MPNSGRLINRLAKTAVDLPWMWLRKYPAMRRKPHPSWRGKSNNDRCVS
jgi:hypothetical protein